MPGLGGVVVCFLALAPTYQTVQHTTLGLAFRPVLLRQASLDTLEAGSPRRAVFFPGTGKKNDLGEGRGK